MPVQVGDLSWGCVLGTTVTPCRETERYLGQPLGQMRTSINGNNKDTYWSKLGVFCFISVVVQSDEVKTRFHLVAAPAKHVLATLTLARFRRTTGKSNVKKFRWFFWKVWRKIAQDDIFNADSHTQLRYKTCEKGHPTECWTAVKACLCNSCKWSFLIGRYCQFRA